MQNDSATDSYRFDFVGGEFNSFFFTTRNDVIYVVRFVPSAYLFEEYVDYYVDAYEMIIAVADNPTGGRLPADPLIAPTIRAIFYDFFRSNEQVIVFICDSSDGRQLARMRKLPIGFTVGTTRGSRSSNLTSRFPIQSLKASFTCRRSSAWPIHA